jgi:hypothetical protein
VEDGPPPLYELIEVVPDYEYRHWIERAGVIAAMFVLTQERRVLISDFS